MLCSEPLPLVCVFRLLWSVCGAYGLMVCRPYCNRFLNWEGFNSGSRVWTIWKKTSTKSKAKLWEEACASVPPVILRLAASSTHPDDCDRRRLPYLHAYGLHGLQPLQRRQHRAPPRPVSAPDPHLPSLALLPSAPAACRNANHAASGRQKQRQAG